MKTIIIDKKINEEIYRIDNFAPFIYMNVGNDIVIKGETYNIVEKIFDIDDTLLIIYTTN